MKQIWSKEELKPHCLAAVELMRASLPAELRDRLTSSRLVKNHGSYRTLFLFNVWDKHQNDILNRDHFCYCLGYDPNRIWGKGGDWYFSVWLNTTRPALNREEIRSVLRTRIPAACPKPFVYRNHGRAIECIYCFDFNRPLEAFPQFIAPLYVSLITSLHPILIPIIDSFRTKISSEQRHAAILARPRERYTQRPISEFAPVREYTRSIPKSWRPRLLDEHNWKCAICRIDLRQQRVHIDHIVPFSRGGMTVYENLQPTCSRCNLGKGNRQAQRVKAPKEAQASQPK